MRRVAYSKDPHDKHLRELLSEAAAKAKLSISPHEVLWPVERSLGLSEETVWSARCGMVGFLLCFALALMPTPSATNNPIFNFMLALAGLGLGSGVGLAVRMLRESRRRDLLAPPALPPRRAPAGGVRGDNGTLAGVEEDDGQDGGEGSVEEVRRKRVKGLSKSLRNRAGR
jgi:hypothetical protein